MVSPIVDLSPLDSMPLIGVGTPFGHACATRLLATGLSLKEIGDHLGHRSTSATSTYAKVNIGALREVAQVDRLGLEGAVTLFRRNYDCLRPARA